MRQFFYSLFFICIVFLISSIDDSSILIKNSPVYQDKFTEQWADSLLDYMSIEQKIGQLFMIIGSGKNLNETYFKSIDTLITNYGIGGVMFLQSNPSEVIRLINRYNYNASIPLLTSIDAEWGLGMRLDSTQSFPWMMTLGAIQDDKLIYDLGKDIGRQCKELGIHINFAPVVDINNNPNNPIIDRRSFSSDRNLVSSKALAYMKGLQSTGVLACAKHFPGHGDTDVDSHVGLPVLNYNRDRLDSLEFFPFQFLINNGLSSVMVGHMNLPRIDTLGIPSSFSTNIISSILKEDLLFNGLIISDALNMGALKNYSQRPGEVEKKAFLAGNDILLCPLNIQAAIDSIKAVVQRDTAALNQLHYSCKKILMLKKWVGVDQLEILEDEYILENPQSRSLERRLSKNAITVLKNDSSILPIDYTKNPKIAYLHIGNDNGNCFYSRLNDYLPISKYLLSSFKNNNQRDSLLQKLKDYDRLIIGLHYLNNNFWDKHIISSQDSIFLNKASLQLDPIISVFGHPSLINSINSNYLNGLILSYQNTCDFQDLTAQFCLGAISANGRLPRLLNQFKEGDGVDVDSLGNILFSRPFDLNVNADSLCKIDSLVNYAISSHAMPGCQIVISRNGHIFFNKSFGYHTYDSINMVETTDLYDIASITKIAAAAPLAMTLVDQKLLKLNKKLKHYTSLYDNSDKKNIRFIDLFTHQSSLHPWIPYYDYFRDDDGKISTDAFSYSMDRTYSIGLTDNLFFNYNYLDTIQQINLSSPLRESRDYKYSDLGFYLVLPILEQLINKKIDIYLTKEIYQELGAFRIMFNPIEKIALDYIVPTELDNYFRDTLIHGYVHDPGAALLGGVALHAGLFSNGIDLMKLMQLFLNKGNFMEKDFFSHKTLNYFTSRPFEDLDNRRGIIFDKPSISNEDGPTCDLVSSSSYGHSGFTGTYTWVDPEFDLIYVFLSNRVYPDSNNDKLIRENIRTEIQKFIYNAIM